MPKTVIVISFHPASAVPLDPSTMAGYWWGYSFRLSPVWDDLWVPGWSPRGKWIFNRCGLRSIVGWMADPN